MRKENEFGNVYHQMNFSREELEVIFFELKMLYSILTSSEDDRDRMIVNLVDRIEKELGIE